MNKTQVFISYSSTDNKKALLIQEHLEKDERLANKINIWRDESRLTAGSKWRDEIIQNLQKSSILILLMSDKAMRSEWVSFEWAYAKGAGVHVIPVLLEEIKQHAVLEQFQFIKSIDEVKLKQIADKLFEHLEIQSNNEFVQSSGDGVTLENDVVNQTIHFIEHSNIEIEVSKLFEYLARTKTISVSDLFSITRAIQQHEKKLDKLRSEIISKDEL